MRTSWPWNGAKNRIRISWTCSDDGHVRMADHEHADWRRRSGVRAADHEDGLVSSDGRFFPAPRLRRNHPCNQRDKDAPWQFASNRGDLDSFLCYFLLEKPVHYTSAKPCQNIPISSGSSIGRMCEEVPAPDSALRKEYCSEVLDSNHRRGPVLACYEASYTCSIEQIDRFFKLFQHVTQIIEVAVQREASGNWLIATWESALQDAGWNNTWDATVVHVRQSSSHHGVPF
jgi:hypothetical protein